ncbi:hypothetical protein [Pantoea cypripedii]|uniref:Uncharacterized protein n=1 Tax=Pantoea cypripedii TaxID=55209 RepID=A0A6B9GCT1_PANCY|nr:hypothetical protein [Pantoea cypripedii]QGY31997.1 hypothetical protein CUN67_23645 [Pantoea cypripedii]
MMNAVVSLSDLAEALIKANKVLAGVAAHKASGGEVKLEAGPEAALRGLRQALSKSDWKHVWDAVEKKENDENNENKKLTWQGKLRGTLKTAWEAKEQQCGEVTKALKKERETYLRNVSHELKWLEDEDEALRTACSGSSSATVREAQWELRALCREIRVELELAKTGDKNLLQDLKKVASDLCDMSAALQSMSAIQQAVKDGQMASPEDPVAVLAGKALKTVRYDLEKARGKLEKHLRERRLCRKGNGSLSEQLKKTSEAAKKAAGMMDLRREMLKPKLPEATMAILTRGLKHNKGVHAIGQTCASAGEVLAALKFMAVKGWYGVENGFAHWFHGAKHSPHDQQIRLAATGPLGMMVNLYRATEDLAAASLEASGKQATVTRQVHDGNSRLKADAQAETVEHYRATKLEELDKKRQATDQQMANLSNELIATRQELDGMWSRTSNLEHKSDITRLRDMCGKTVKACQDSAAKMGREMDQLVNPAGDKADIKANALNDKDSYQKALYAIQGCQRDIQQAMKQLELTVAHITGKSFALFSKDAQLAKYCADMLYQSETMLPEDLTDAERDKYRLLIDHAAEEAGAAFPKKSDPEGTALKNRIKREISLRRAGRELKPETLECATKYRKGWAQKLADKASGKVSSDFSRWIMKSAFKQALPELFGVSFPLIKVLKLAWGASRLLEAFHEDMKRVNATVTPGTKVPTEVISAMRKAVVLGLAEKLVTTVGGTPVKLIKDIAALALRVRSSGCEEAFSATIKALPKESLINLGFEAPFRAGTEVVRLVREGLNDAAQATASDEERAGEVEKIPVGNSRPAEEQVKSRRKRSTQPDMEQAAAAQPPVTGVPEDAEDDNQVNASQRTSVGSTDASEFSMTEAEYNDTQIGIDVRNNSKIRTFIEKDIQKVIDRHPDGHGKITSPYSYVDTVNYKTQPPTFKRMRVIDIYTGNGAPDDVKILWEGGTGKRDSTDTSEAFRRELFGHKPYKSNKEKPFEIIPLEVGEIDVEKYPRSYTRLRQEWAKHMTEMRKRMPELATLYRSIFKLGFTNALDSPENDLSATEKATIREYLKGNTNRVITLRYNGERVPDVIALVVPGTPENKTHILIMDYDGNFKRVKATRVLGEVEDTNVRYSFEPDEETQQFISRHLVLGDREKAAEQKTPKIIMDPSSHYDTKLADRYFTAQEREFDRVVADAQKENLDNVYKVIDTTAGYVGMALGMAGFPKSTPMGMIASAVITTAKGLVKYIITPADDTVRLRNIRNQTVRDVITGGIADGTVGKTMDNMPKNFNKTAKSGLTWYQKSTTMSGDAGKIINQGADPIYDWMGLTIEDTERSDTLFSNAERSSALSEEALTSTSGDGVDKSRTEKLWDRTMANLSKGFDELRYNRLSTDTLRDLEELGIGYKKILDKHGKEDSIKEATVDGVTDYSQVEYDQHGVNELWGDASKAYKKWAQSERLKRMIGKLEELESKVTGDQTIQIPFDLLKDFRDSGFNIDEHLLGNADNDDNNTQTQYRRKPEHTRLNHTELKRLKFIAKAKQLKPSDINGALRLLDEIRYSLSGDEKTTIPNELQEILEKHGIKVKDYIRVHGDVKPAHKDVGQQGSAEPEQHVRLSLKLSDRIMDKHQFGDLAVMARLKLLEKNVQAPKNEVESLISRGTPGRLSTATIKTLRDNGINIDAIAQRYGTPSSKEAAISGAGELNVAEVDIDTTGARLLKTKIDQKIRQYKISIMIERMKSLKKTPAGGYRLPNDITDFIKQGQATPDGELFLEHLRHKNISDSQLKSLRWMLEAEVELSHESTYEELVAFVQKMESDTAPGEKVTLPSDLIHYLRARGVNIDKFLQEKGDLVVAKDYARIRGDESRLNKAEIEIDKNHLREIEDMIVAQKRKAEATDMMKRLNGLKTSIDANGDVALPEDIRKFVLASQEIDDNDPYLEELKSRPVTKAELDWLYWVLKSETELDTDSTPEQTIAFMRKMESSMVGDETKPLPPRLTNRLRSHGINVDDYLERSRDIDPAKNFAVSRTIDKSRLREIEDMIVAQKRKTEATDMMKRLNDLRTSIDANGEVDLPEDIRKFVLASKEMDDNNLYLAEFKWRTVTRAELDWLYWSLKAETELGTDSTPEQTIAFMRKMESSMVGDETRPLPPRLIDRLNSHGINVDDYLKRFGDTGPAKNFAVLRGNENILDSRDIKLSKPGLTKLREMLAALPAAQPAAAT